MRAIVISEHGGPEVLRLVERPDPSPAAGEVLVRVGAAAVNRLDIWVRENVGHAYEANLPLIPGYDVAGEVVAVGEGVTTVAAGDRVFVHCDFSCGRCEYCLEGDEAACAQYEVLGVSRDGGYAKYVVIPVRNAFSLADSLSFETAAAAGSVYLTAYHMLF
jgi:NADPH:quinone reductase-like Zn-dependent oxidoreductase